MSQRISDLARRLLLSWLFSAVIELSLLPEGLRTPESLSGLSRMSFPRALSLTLAGTVFLSLLSHPSRMAVSKHRKIIILERLGTIILFLLLGGISLHASFSWFFFAACALALILLLIYGIYGWDSSSEPVIPPFKSMEKNKKRMCPRMILGCSVLFFLFVSIWGLGRVYSFSTPTYDFGIFSQMFYSMKKSGRPLTTLERDCLLSHFHVHVSPVYYLLLPLYLLFPFPAALQVFQAAVLASSVIPLRKLGNLHGLSRMQQALLCLSLMLYPAFSGGCGYDIHENCFLAPLLLWIFYGIDKKSTLTTALSSLLTLMVKEDAAVYVASISLWLILRSLLRCDSYEASCKLQKDDLSDRTQNSPCDGKTIQPRQGSRRNLLTGTLMLTAALLWFFFSTGYLAKYGDGIMTNRYDNFLYEGSSSLLSVVKSVFLHPMRTVYECADPEKLPFLAITLLPLLGLPLFTRRYERYFLLIPYILVNLMPGYPYQHHIFFQYTFGSAICLFYLTLINLADLNAKQKPVFPGRKPLLSPAASVTAILFTLVIINAACFGSVVVPKAISYPLKFVQNWDHYLKIRNTLSLVPENAPVTASTFYTTYLSQRETLYDVQYASPEHVLDTDYIVFDPSSKSSFKKYLSDGNENGLETFILFLEEHGYERWVETEEAIIYRRFPPDIFTPDSSP